jgi:hypothetical protein
LHGYLTEFAFRYCYRIKTGFDDMARMDKALASMVGRRLTYRSVGGNGAAEAPSSATDAGPCVAAGDDYPPRHIELLLAIRAKPE